MSHGVIWTLLYQIDTNTTYISLELRARQKILYCCLIG